MQAHTCAPGTWEVEGRGPRVQGHSWLQAFKASFAWLRLVLKDFLEADKKGQGIKELITKPEDESWILRIHLVGGENWLPQVVLCLPHECQVPNMCLHAHAHMCVGTHTHK